jgi:putative transcriptional regulator
MAIVVNLEEQLKLLKMTSKQLCEKVGITEANMSILRSGKAKGVRFSTLNRICLYLKCDVGDILHFDGKEENNEETDIAVD